jgi:hypothetical protein
MRKLRELKTNKQGIAYVIGVAFLSVVFMPFVYFPLSMAWDQLYTAITGDYVFTGVFVPVITVVRLFISYLLIFALLFTIAWALTNAKKKRYFE